MDDEMTDLRPIRLGVNVDHVATVRNARGGRHPDPVRAAQLAIKAGADGITAHLREEIPAPLNFEMAATDEMLKIALATKPHAACLVPEKRTERTTEGGLEVARAKSQLAPKVAFLSQAGIRVSLFIEPDQRQIQAAADVHAAVVELHTGAWCEAVMQGRTHPAEYEFERLRAGARQAHQLGLEVHAGHGLDFDTAEAISMFPEIKELNIGHYMIGEAIFDGLENVVKKMRAAMERGRARAKGEAA
jgi:pyridoxine 5-phosphate synthase